MFLGCVIITPLMTVDIGREVEQLVGYVLRCFYGSLF
jgi:hypothetical protein